MDWYKKIFQKRSVDISVLEIFFILVIVFNFGVLVEQKINQEKVKEIANEQTTKITEGINNSINSQNNSLEDLKNKISQLEILVTPTMIPTPTLTPPNNQVLGSETSSYLGMVQVKPDASINVYKNPMLNSAIIYTATPSALLFYTKKEDNWYQIDLIDQNQIGWVSGNDIQEK